MSGETEIQSFFSRWQNLEERKAEVADDLKELFAEAKSRGFEPKAMRIAFNQKIKDENITDKDRELAAMVDVYRSALDAPRARPAPAHTREAPNSQAKASVDNGATGDPDGRAADSVTGDASRASAGAGTGAPIQPETANEMDRDGRTTAKPNNAVPAENARKAVPDEPEDGSVNHAGAGESPAPQFTNPLCQHPDTCHFLHSRDCCFDCSIAWSERPKDEQRRLWQEAIDAGSLVGARLPQIGGGA